MLPLVAAGVVNTSVRSTCFPTSLPSPFRSLLGPGPASHCLYAYSVGGRDSEDASATDDSTSQEELHQKAEAHLRWVIEESGEFPDLPDLDQMPPEQVVSLGGGVDAATYLIKRPRGDVVVKLNSEGLEAEARALRAWKRYTPHVPEVLGIGTVPSSEEPAIKYLLLAAMKNDKGEVVETAKDYLEQSPASARELGRAVGVELHRMHQAVDDTGFGNFADSPGSERTYRSWSAYLEDFFVLHADFVQQLGIDDDRIRAARAFIQSRSFVAEARFLHGDVTIRNVGVYSDRPITVGLFDPNPLSGDPSWDIAPMMNNAAFNELRHRREGVPPDALTRDRELLAGFWESYPRDVAEESLATAQLVQAILQSEHRQDRLNRSETDTIEVEVTHEFIRSMLDRAAA
jgi:aminoglycoside phosphotransferase (APT) family kinase protein